jgi:hypothetical protein
MLNIADEFALTLDVLALEQAGHKTRLVIIPLGSSIQLKSLSCFYDERMVEVSWRDRTLMLFASDLHHAGRKLPVLAARASDRLTAAIAFAA